MVGLTSRASFFGRALCFCSPSLTNASPQKNDQNSFGSVHLLPSLKLAVRRSPLKIDGLEDLLCFFWAPAYRIFRGFSFSFQGVYFLPWVQRFFSGDPFVQLWYFNGSQGDQVLEGPKSRAKIEDTKPNQQKRTHKQNTTGTHFSVHKKHDIFFFMLTKALLTKSVKELKVIVLSLAFCQWD